MRPSLSIALAWREGLAVEDLPEALAEACDHLVSHVRDAAPVDTGDLSDSVHATPVRASGSRISAAVVVDSDHAMAEEYGNVHQAGTHFFRRTCLAEMDRMRSLVAKVADA